MNYSNPRTKAIIEDWPIGSGARGTCIFEVETHPKRGQRCTRVTEKRNGTWGKPKLMTYADEVRIVDGDDGKTYILNLSRGYGMIGVMQSNMKYEQETIHESDDRYAGMLTLFLSAAVGSSLPGLADK